MADSDRFAPPIMIAVALVLASCAQVTGLSDDYRYDLADAGSDGATTNDGSTNEGGHADRCDSTERTRAQQTISEAAGDDVPLECRSCMASSCCDEIARCAQNDDCAQSMKCIFNCQRSSAGGGGGGKNQCVNGCRPTFTATVGACLQQHCAAPSCQLQ